MRSILSFLIIFLIAACSDNREQANSEVNSCKPIVAVYPVWNHSEENFNTLPWSTFSHLGIAAIYPLESGELNTTDADRFVDNLVSAAHNHDKKVIISVGGAALASKAFLAIASDESRLNTFVKNIAAYVEMHKLDGVDIDWEYWSYQSELSKGGNDPKESAQLVNLMKVLRNTLSSEKILTVDIAAGYWLGEQYLPELQEHVDFVNLMAFDFTGAWPESPIAYHSQYSDFKKAIQYSLDKGFNANKLIVGIPAYAIEFKDGNNQSIEHHSYKSVVDRLEGSQRLLNKGRFENTFFETAKDIKKKARYITDENLRGAFIFEINSDTKQAHLSVAHALAVEFGEGLCDTEK